MQENSFEGNYARRVRRWFREEFERGQVVRVAKNEN